MNQPNGKSLRVREVADILQCSPYVVYKAIRKGELPAFRIGAGLRIREATLRIFMEKPIPSKVKQAE